MARLKTEDKREAILLATLRLVNSNGFYDHLIAHIRHMYNEDFLYETLEDRIVVVKEPSAIFTNAAV